VQPRNGAEKRFDAAKASLGLCGGETSRDRMRLVSSVDLYNTSYGNSGDETYREVRLETYGEDFGQTSWTTAEEYREIALALELRRESNVLEIGCGAGGCAIFFAETAGCRVTGLDINSEGISSASALARGKGLGSQLSFRRCDVSKGIPFEPDVFDAVYSNDAFCHFIDRPGLFRECFRILKPLGRMIFSDALVITGAVSNDEIAARSSIGHYLFVPPGKNERLLKDAGFQVLRSNDTTSNAALIAQRWHDARARRKPALVAIESEPNFDGLQKFLRCVHTLTSEKRLSRYLYLAVKP
jgi:cyclopropane fatty-acyl-phospholipid synthase-like methyltransferase